MPNASAASISIPILLGGTRSRSWLPWTTNRPAFTGTRSARDDGGNSVIVRGGSARIPIEGPAAAIVDRVLSEHRNLHAAHADEGAQVRHRVGGLNKGVELVARYRRPAIDINLVVRDHGIQRQTKDLLPDVQKIASASVVQAVPFT